jgi:hypothetical protein
MDIHAFKSENEISTLPRQATQLIEVMSAARSRPIGSLQELIQ